VRQWTELLFTRRGPALADEQRANLDAMSGYFRALADRKRVTPGDDLISFLVRAEDADDRLNDTELLLMIFIANVADHTTTVNQIGNGVVALLGSRRADLSPHRAGRGESQRRHRRPRGAGDGQSVSPPLIATRPASLTPTASMSPARTPTATSPSARAFTPTSTHC